MDLKKNIHTRKKWVHVSWAETPNKTFVSFKDQFFFLNEFENEMHI